MDKDAVCVFFKNHRILEYPELKSAHKNHQNPTTCPSSQDKNHIMYQRALSKHFLNSDRLGTSSNF